jgi:vancomycin permeability regulator SanA
MKIRIRKRWLVPVLAILVWLLVHAIYITADGLNDYKGNADVAVVLGNTVFRDSSLSQVLEGRVDAALRLYQDGRVKKIFVSGGSGEYGVGEGDGMKRYLLIKGVPPNDIIADNGGKNTYMTARDFLDSNQEFHFSSAIVVSSYYHITRIKYIFRKLGFHQVEGTHSHRYFPEDGEKMIREFFAFYKYLTFY